MRHARVSCLALTVILAAACAPPSDGVGPHGMKLFAPGDDKADAPEGSHLVYHGGPVISNVRVLPVYWGEGVTHTQEFDSFYAAITQSAYMDWLSEYDTPTQHIGRGSFGGSIHDTQPFPANVAPPATVDLATGSDPVALDAGRVREAVDGGEGAGSEGNVTTVTVTSDALTGEITRLIQAGQLPAEDGNNLYMIHVPANVAVTDPAVGTSCQSFCAYHNSFELDGHPVYFAVIPECGGPCVGASNDVFQGMTTAVAHELIEAVTDPNVGPSLGADSSNKTLAWLDDSNGEIGDICQWQTGVTIAGFTVQSEWSNAHRACITTSPDVSGQGGEFALATIQASRTVAHGAATAFLLSTLTQSGAVGKIELHVADAPMGVSTAFSAPIIPAGDDSTLTVQVAASVAPGTYTITVEANAHSATGTPIKESLPLTLVVVDHGAADFTLMLQDQNADVPAGSQLTVHVLTTPVSGPTQLRLSVLNLPTGATGHFDRDTINAGDQAFLTIAVDAHAPPSRTNYAVVAVSSDGIQHSEVGELNITAQPSGNTGDFVIAVAPLDRSVGIGGTTSYTIVTAANTPLGAPITMSIGGLPQGVVAAFDPPVLQANQSSVLTIAAGAGATLGAAVLTLRATSGSLEHDSQAILRVLQP